jgi:hypothetical protein
MGSQLRLERGEAQARFGQWWGCGWLDPVAELWRYNDVKR